MQSRFLFWIVDLASLKMSIIALEYKNKNLRNRELNSGLLRDRQG